MRGKFVLFIFLFYYNLGDGVNFCLLWTLENGLKEGRGMCKKEGKKGITDAQIVVFVRQNKGINRQKEGKKANYAYS